jgi:hypothetical protein
MPYDFSGMNAELVSTFGETVIHTPIASGSASQEVRMIFSDPVQTNGLLPGPFSVLTAPRSAFDSEPVEEDMITFRGVDYRVFEKPSYMASGMLRIAVTQIAE